MKEVYEVTLTYTALVLADDAEDAEEIARKERGEITSDMDPKIESGCTIRSRQELDAYSELTGDGWGEDCLPYGGDGVQRLAVILAEIEEADVVAAAAFSARCPNTVDMFEVPKPEAAPEPVQPPNFYLMAARKLTNQGEDWHWCSMEHIGDGEGAAALIEGGLPNINYEGKRRWTGVRLERVVVTEVYRAATALAWERETGKCHLCGGSGQENIGWHYQTGGKYRDCPRCAASGQAVAS